MPADKNLCLSSVRLLSYSSFRLRFSDTPGNEEHCCQLSPAPALFLLLRYIRGFLKTLGSYTITPHIKPKNNHVTYSPLKMPKTPSHEILHITKQYFISRFLFPAPPHAILCTSQGSPMRARLKKLISTHLISGPIISTRLLLLLKHCNHSLYRCFGHSVLPICNALVFKMGNATVFTP